MCAAAQCDMAFASACHPRRAAACFLTAAAEDAPSYQPDRTTSVSCFVCCAFIAWPTTPGTMVLGAVCTIPNRIQQYRPRSDRLSAPTFVECTPNWVCNWQKSGKRRGPKPHSSEVAPDHRGRSPSLATRDLSHWCQERSSCTDIT